MDPERLRTMDVDELRTLFTRGHPIDVTALEDQEYEGTSLGIPAFIERLTWAKFRKCFHRDPATGHLRGWNVRVEQNGLDAPWVATLRDGVPKTFGHYRVVDAAAYRSPVAHRGIMLDYALGRGSRFDPLRRLRDPIVALAPNDVTWLLGFSYLDLGVRQVGTPSFFLLRRGRALSHVA